MPDLIPVLLPRKEVQQRLTMARQTAKTARALAGGVAQFGPKSQRSAAKIAKYTEQAEECEAIAASCAAGLKSVEASTEETATEERSIPAMAGLSLEEMPDVSISVDVDEEGG